MPLVVWTTGLLTFGAALLFHSLPAPVQRSLSPPNGALRNSQLPGDASSVDSVSDADLPAFDELSNLHNGWRTHRVNNQNNAFYGGTDTRITKDGSGAPQWARLLSSYPVTAGPLYSTRQDLIYTGTAEGMLIALRPGCNEEGSCNQ